MDEPARYCDLVMKGGFASGMVYPNAVLALATEFRFKNIGGTSVGAIAAAATAAASMGDRVKRAEDPIAQDPERVGFEGLAKVSADLSTEGFVFGLMQPKFGLRNAYRILTIATGTGNSLGKIAGILACIVAIAPIETVLVLTALLAVGLMVGGPGGALAALLPSLICAYLAGAVFAARRVANVTRKNLLGMCTGLRANPTRGVPAMTEWLHTILQDLSGKSLDQPLTFTDLWTAPHYANEPQSDRTLSLQMITADVSHWEPRSLPFLDGRFWFLEEEFMRLFPASVVTWLVDKADRKVVTEGKTYHRLPAGSDLPILVATRMSLCFPLLFSAVPLHEPSRWAKSKKPVDATDDAAAQKTTAASVEALTTGGGDADDAIEAFRLCWFIDGGVASNFPIHLFDAALPRWPTFAINLVGAKDAKAGDDVVLPPDNKAGWRRIYQPIAMRSAIGEIGNFAFAIIGTMQNWRDLLQSRAPGHRDRIAQVTLSAGQGGYNLNMPQGVLDAMAAKGTRAGEVFRTFSFDNHYWIRWRNLAATLQRFMKEAARNAKSPIPDYAGAFDIPNSGSPPPPSYKFGTREEQEESQRLFKQVLEEGAEWQDLSLDLSESAPRPSPQLRVTPIY